MLVMGDFVLKLGGGMEGERNLEKIRSPLIRVYLHFQAPPGGGNVCFEKVLCNHSHPLSTHIMNGGGKRELNELTEKID